MKNSDFPEVLGFKSLKSFHEQANRTDTRTRSACRDRLTAGPVAVVAEVAFLRLHGYARLFPHRVDLRHAKLGVELEKQPPVQNGQVVLVPVPQVLQVLVVDGRERVHADERKERK